MERQNPLLRRRPRRPHPRAMWTIRAKILTLLLLPVVPLLAMWMFTTGATLGPALNLFSAVTNLQSAGQPATALIDRLQVERQLSMSWVGGRHDTATKNALTAARARTDAATATFRRDTATSTFHRAESDTTRGYLGVLDAALDRLTAQRSAIDHARTSTGSGNGSGGRAPAAAAGTVMAFYNGVIDNAVGLYGSILGADDHDLARQANTVNGLIQAREMFAREDAIVTGAVAAHTLSPADYTTFVATVGTERYLYQQATRFLPVDEQRTYQSVLASAAFTRLRGDEDLLGQRTPTRSGLPAGFDAARWRTDFDVVNTQLTAIESDQAAANLAATRPAAIRIVVRLAVAGGVGLVVLIALIFISIRLARNIIARVHGLRTDALDLARHRLPSVVERLRRGDEVDVAVESPALAYGTDEVGQLGDAFSRVQRTAIAAAVQEAELRRGLNQMFLNIARRSQTLLHRQLALLDDMERRVTDPDDLSELFRIDHLATRMRRHAEDLVILAGSTPGRAWRYPVALADVLRAAAAEVEQYTRISVRELPEVAVAGRAVGDTVHLVAELLENATAFSPPDTQVTVSAQLVPHGFAIEIEDRGLGMTTDALADANARLSGPPNFHPVPGTRLGLFVVTRLAAKHGIAVTLRRSPFGGVTAVVLLPPELVVAEADAVALTSRSTRTGTRMLTAAPAGLPAASPAEPTEPTEAAERTEPAEPAEPAETSVVDASASEPEVVSDLTKTIATTTDGDVDDGDSDIRARGAGPTLPRQRTLTLVAPPPPASTVRGVTAEGLPQRVRPSGRGDRAVRIAPPLATDHVVTDSPVTTAPVRTDGDATVRETPRTPERMRTMLTSFQDGTALGRRRRAATDAVPGAEAPSAPHAADPATAAEPPDVKANITDTSNTNTGDTNTGSTDTGEAGGPYR
ncbi:MAG TPA: sensor histidine kinase [Micromonosporaceae bacterium]|nr:sensor histidine kinase [Micromonosporaceae bacterium]